MTFKKLLGTVGIAFSVLFVGCSDVPRSGYLDTQIASDIADIVDIRGDVYGAKAGTFALIEQFENDRIALMTYSGDDRFSYPDEVFKAIRAGGEMPSLSLTFPEGEGFPDMSNIESVIQDEVRGYIKGVEGEVSEQIAGKEKEIAELEAKITQYDAKLTKYQSDVKAAKAEYESARTKLNTAINAYNQLRKTSVAKLNEVVATSGIDKRYDANPLERYRYIDFSGKTKPAACPSQRRRLPVNMLDEWGKCLYIQDLSGGNNYGTKGSEVAKVAKKYLLELDQVRAEIGKEGGWSSKPTGLYLAVDSAENAYRNAQRGKTVDLRNPGTVERNVNRAKEQILRFEGELAEYRAPEYLQEKLMSNGQMDGYRRSISDESADLLQDYIGAMRDQLDNQVVKVTELTFDEESEDGHFENFEGDFDAISIASNIVASVRGRRSAQSMITVEPLLDPALAEQDLLQVELTKRDAERFEMSDVSKIRKETIDRLLKMDLKATAG